MSNLDVIKSLYKPYRYTINKKVTLIESTSGRYVVKKQNKDLFTLFNYLENRDFYHFPSLVRNIRNEDNVFEFVEEEKLPPMQKLNDLASVLASLHNKTVYFKNVSLDDYKEIRENIDNNIRYLSNYFESLFLQTLKEEYLSPSKYLFARNYFKIKQCLNFCISELDNWYDMVINKDKQRVSVVHNNLLMEHFITSREKKALISWDDYKIDTPILDFVKLYQNEYLNYDFSEFLQKYLYNFELTKEEQILLFILISLPFYFELDDSEFKNTKTVYEKIKYIYDTEKLIRPYYPEKKEEQETDF